MSDLLPNMGKFDKRNETYNQFLIRNVERKRSMYLDYITDKLSLKEIGQRYGVSATCARTNCLQQFRRHFRWAQKQEEIKGPYQHAEDCRWKEKSCGCGYWLKTVHRALGWE